MVLGANSASGANCRDCSSRFARSCDSTRENPPDISQPPLKIPRKAKILNLELPIGSNEGAYHVALLDPSGAERFRGSGTAKLKDHIVVLRADVDFAGISPGSYFLGLRRPGLEWMRFPVRVLSERTTQRLERSSESSAESASTVTIFYETMSDVFRSIIVAIVSRSSSQEVLPCGFSFPGSQSFSYGDY